MKITTEQCVLFHNESGFMFIPDSVTNPEQYVGFLGKVYITKHASHTPAVIKVLGQYNYYMEEVEQFTIVRS